MIDLIFNTAKRNFQNENCCVFLGGDKFPRDRSTGVDIHVLNEIGP